MISQYKVGDVNTMRGAVRVRKKDKDRGLSRHKKILQKKEVML